MIFYQLTRLINITREKRASNADRGECSIVAKISDVLGSLYVPLGEALTLTHIYIYIYIFHQTYRTLNPPIPIPNLER